MRGLVLICEQAEKQDASIAGIQNRAVYVGPREGGANVRWTHDSHSLLTFVCTVHQDTGAPPGWEGTYYPSAIPMYINDRMSVPAVRRAGVVCANAICLARSGSGGVRLREIIDIVARIHITLITVLGGAPHFSY